MNDIIEMDWRWTNVQMHDTEILVKCRIEIWETNEILWYSQKEYGFDGNDHFLEIYNKIMGDDGVILLLGGCLFGFQ